MSLLLQYNGASLLIWDSHAFMQRDNLKPEKHWPATESSASMSEGKMRGDMFGLRIISQLEMKKLTEMKDGGTKAEWCLHHERMDLNFMTDGCGKFNITDSTQNCAQLKYNNITLIVSAANQKKCNRYLVSSYTV